MLAEQCPGSALEGQGQAVTVKGFEIERAIRGRKREAQNKMTNWRQISNSGLKIQYIYNVQQCWACISYYCCSGKSCHFTWCELCGVNSLPKDQKSSSRPWWKRNHMVLQDLEILQKQEKMRSMLIFHLPQMHLCPSYITRAFPFTCPSLDVIPPPQLSQTCSEAGDNSA